MNGLEEIVLAIGKKADNMAKDIISRAKLEADKIIEDAEKEGELRAEKIKAQGEQKASRIVESAKAGVVSNEALSVLTFKSETTGEIIDEINEHIGALPDKEYFEVIEKLVVSNYHKNELGIISFSKEDTARVPKNFIEKINNKISSDNAKLTLGESVPIKNGFILKYNDIEENCSFKAITDSKRDDLKDIVNATLFA
ncbi:MAG: hypothetical protein IKF53_01675 [Clostridia bacterium]|nr:hypothetical protein [Clostridia bacterium]